MSLENLLVFACPNENTESCAPFACLKMNIKKAIINKTGIKLAKKLRRLEDPCVSLITRFTLSGSIFESLNVFKKLSLGSL